LPRSDSASAAVGVRLVFAICSSRRSVSVSTGSRRTTPPSDRDGSSTATSFSRPEGRPRRPRVAVEREDQCHVDAAASAIMAAIAAALLSWPGSSEQIWLVDAPCRSRADAIVPSVSWRDAARPRSTRNRRRRRSRRTPPSAPESSSTSAITRSVRLFDGRAAVQGRQNSRRSRRCRRSPSP